jgi:hypothetical protein
MLPGLMAVKPELGLHQLFQLNLVSEHTIVVQHWGYMIFLVGLLMVISAFKANLVFPVMLYATLEKAGMVFLCITHNDQPWAAGFRQAAVVDGICVLYAVIYFYSLQKDPVAAEPHTGGAR